MNHWSSAGIDTPSREFVTGSGFFGLYGRVLQEDSGGQYGVKFLPPESVSFVAVAELEVAHFKARLVFRLSTPSVEMDDLKLELPSANLVVYHLQVCIGRASIYRIGIQSETDDSLVYNFGHQSIRSSVEVIIRGSFRYLENPGVGLVTLVFPSLVGSCPQAAASASASRRHAEEAHGRELRLEVQCLLSLPAPCLRSVGCQLRSVSPDGCRVFLRHLETRNIWESVEFCVLCGIRGSECPSIVLHHPAEQQQVAADSA